MYHVGRPLSPDNPRLTESGEVNDMCGFILFEELLGLLWVPEEVAKLESNVFARRVIHTVYHRFWT
jgi:hypothetical protein